jgi:hypothetical protein
MVVLVLQQVQVVKAAAVAIQFFQQLHHPAVAARARRKKQDPIQMVLRAVLAVVELHLVQH